MKEKKKIFTKTNVVGVAGATAMIAGSVGIYIGSYVLWSKAVEKVIGGFCGVCLKGMNKLTNDAFKDIISTE